MTLEEALAAATVDAATTEYCTVDDDTRLVTVPDKYKKLGVESDEKAKRIWFRFPKLVGNNGVDLSAIGVRVNFRNANGEGDIYIVEDLTTDGDYVNFSWELTRKVTAYKGHVSFVVCAVKSATDGTTKNEWNTTLNKECEVLEGLEVSEQIAQENPDIIEYILANLGGSVSAEEIATAVEEYMLAHPIEVPKNISDLINDSGFITKAVSDLENYYRKTETYTKEEVNNLVSLIPKFSIEVVSSLPTTDISNTTIYFVLSGEESSNLYTEYIYINGAWEILGTQSVDLSGYALKTELPTKTSDLQNDSNFIQSPATATIGQVLEVETVDENGKPTAWKTATLQSGLPAVTTADNGKFLRVSDGAWTSVALTDVSEVGA